MKKELFNGNAIPYDLSFEELNRMLFSDDMTEFCLACEALSCRDDSESFNALKSFLKHPDKYRRLYAMKTVFRNPASAELQYVLEEALASGDPLFINAACEILAEKSFGVDENILRSAVKSHLPDIHAGSLFALKTLSPSEANYAFLLKLFRASSHSSGKEILGKLLMNKYLPEKAEKLFAEFRSSDFSAVRMLAVAIGKEYGLDLSVFCSDVDGHIRNAASCKKSTTQMSKGLGERI